MFRFDIYKNSAMKKIIIAVAFVFVIVLIAFFAIGKTEIKFNQDNRVSDYYKSNFYKIYNSDKLIVVDLWASWCAPCIKNLPKFDSLSKQFKGKNVQFITLSIEKDTLKCKKSISENDFLKSHDVTLENFPYRDSIYSNIEFIDYHVKSSFFKVSSQKIPYIAVIKNKKIIFKSSEDEVNMDKLSKTIENNINK